MNFSQLCAREVLSRIYTHDFEAFLRDLAFVLQVAYDNSDMELLRLAKCRIYRCFDDNSLND